jgi:hypothetical protein
MCCREITFKEAFPVLYGIAHDKGALVVAHLDSESGSLHGMLAFLE